MTVSAKHMSQWIQPVFPPGLGAGDTHVWKAALDQPSNVFSELRSFLSDDEIERMAGFTQEEAGKQFAVGRGVLRQLLSTYLESSPAELILEYGSSGKPILVSDSEPCPVHFNVSHSQGLVLLAFSKDGPVGIDVEREDRKVNIEGVSRRFFTEREYERLMLVEEGERQTAFVQLWTCKEACLKWSGEGIAGSLARYEIHFRKDDSPVASGEGEQPLLLCFRPTDGFMGALATATSLQPASFWHWVG